MFQRPMNMLDELNRTLLITGLVCAIINAFFFRAGTVVGTVLSVIAAATLIFAVIRLLGGHPEKRSQENMKFLTGVTAVKGFFGGLFSGGAGASATKTKTHRAHKARKNPSWSEIKQYKYFMCPQCAQRLRVPRGKGKLRVTCTNCGNVFETKS